MNANQAIQIFSRLAECNSTKQLSNEMRSIIEDSFSQSSMKVFEMIPARTAVDERPSNIVYKDTDTFEVLRQVEESDEYIEALAARKPFIQTSPDGTRETSIPVVLSDLNISHIITVKHSKTSKKDNDTLDSIILAFASLFRTLHEKNYDPLTRVLNRQAFEEACLDLEYFSDRASNSFITPFGVIAIIDIDFFKDINDRFGHAIGDEVLVLFSRLMSSIIRDEDKFFRIGGEEFVLLLRLRDPQKSGKILERYRKAVDKKTFPQVQNLTVSIGYASLKKSTHPMTQLAKADRALYYAKANGRNKVYSYDSLLAEGKIDEVIETSPDTEFWTK